MAKATFLGTYSSADPESSQAYRLYWFVWENPAEEAYFIQRLDHNFKPCAPIQSLALDFFQGNFLREPKITLRPARDPEVKMPEQEVHEPEGHLAMDKSDDFKDWLNSSPLNPQTALWGGEDESLDLPPDLQLEGGPTSYAKSPAQELDQELRQKFKQAQEALKKGKLRDSTRVFSELSQVYQGIETAHKHMFTDFGIALRQHKLYELALEHFYRALELSPGDSHAFFNLARIMYEKGDLLQAKAYLDKCLDLEPELRYALILKQRIQKDLL